MKEITRKNRQIKKNKTKNNFQWTLLTRYYKNKKRMLLHGKKTRLLHNGRQLLQTHWRMITANKSAVKTSDHSVERRRFNSIIYYTTFWE